MGERARGHEEPASFVIVGRVRKPQGIHGEVLVDVATDNPGVVFAPGRCVLASASAGGNEEVHEPLTVRRARAFKGGYIIGFSEISDRDAAEQWRGRYLCVPATELAPLGSSEVYRHDLIDMLVRDVAGAEIGVVTDLYELPQGLMLEVRTGKGTTLVPYRPEIVKAIDLQARSVILDPPAGLIE